MTDFRPTAPLAYLRERSRMLQRLREFFYQQRFWEVETPLLSSETIVDAHLDPLQVRHPLGRHGSEGPNYWLQTSPELGMKRLLAAGADAIFQITRAMRREEFGPRHNPEFTIVEWYRVGDGLQEGMRLLSDLAAAMLGRDEAQRVTYRQLFESRLGFNPHRVSLDELRAVADRHGVPTPSSMNPTAPPRRRADVDVTRPQADDTDQLRHAARDTWLDLLMSELIETDLGRPVPVIVYDYPSSQAALARTNLRDGDLVAERFELYVDGVELANGYHELLDAETLAARQTAANAARTHLGKPELPPTTRLLEAMRHGLPPCTGVALGLDRLLMVQLRVEQISDVIAFPFDRA